MASATNTKVNLSHAPINVGGGFDTANKWFKPTIAGYYQIFVQLAAPLTTNTSMGATIRLNGSTVFSSNTVVPTATNGFSSTQSIVYLNGTTDYVEFYGAQNTGASGSFLGATNYTFFTANRIA